MSHSRFNAIDNIQNRSMYDVEPFDPPSHVISSFFGCNVFNEKAMRKYLDEESYLKVKAAIQSGSKLSRTVAETVATAMKKWAQDKGASHYAHWFQPLTGRTAEKHDSFFTLDMQGNAIEEFKGEALSQQEPDGSSFPGGGLRSTFEARGYTAWDPSSPAFILEVGDGMTLCIPTIFVTYSGEALDYKLPLLKSQSWLEEAAIPICKWFDKKISKVNVTLGWEQEYFVVDEALFNARPDLIMTGRTLIGKASPKGQQLDDHYFGSIPERVYAYMRDLETECHKLGIPVRTRHNEVGPGQYELAPMFEDVNVAVDHNQLLMDLMERVASRHKLRILLHEKPFSGVNGSGKHNNWSLSTNTGVNLLSPGSNPGKNLRFLSFFVNTIMAVHSNPDLLRATVASFSNDHRLGANEAPPAIVSVFIGQKMTQVLNQIEKGKTSKADVKDILNLLSKVPDLEKDNTDRNRTSPFAFTGNKFEVRMVGSNQNCAAPMTILNMLMGQQLLKFRNDVEGVMKKNKKGSQDTAILTVLKKYIKESKNIRFEGDNYSDDWKKEAKKRGLSNNVNTPSALAAYVSKESKKLYKDSGVLTPVELDAHYDVMLENYILNMDIESKTLEELCLNYVIPAGITYQTRLAQNMAAMKTAGIPAKECAVQKELILRISKAMNTMNDLGKKMTKERDTAHKAKSAPAGAKAFCDKIKPLMEKIRVCADEIEMLVDDQDWQLPKYREMMFLK